MNSKTNGETFQFFSKRGKTKHFATPKEACKNFATPKSVCENFSIPQAPCENFARTAKKFANQLCLVKTLRILTTSMLNANGQWESQKSLKQAYLKTSRCPICLYTFRSPHSLLRKTPCHLANWFSLHSMPRGHPIEEATSTSRPISAMARIRGGHTDPSIIREARPRASSPQDSSQALTILSSKGEVPSSPPQCQYSTQRPPTSPPPEPSVRRILPKRARTLGPGETSRHA